MLAIFLSFREAGAVAAWIAAPEGRARSRRADGSGQLCAVVVMRRWNAQDGLKYCWIPQAKTGMSMPALSVAETHAASARSGETARIAGICAE
jgi:hypothetical protein